MMGWTLYTRQVGGFDALRHMAYGTKLESALNALGNGSTRSLDRVSTAE